MVGIGCLSLFIALLASRKSTQMRIPPFFFGTITVGLNHGVGPSTFSIMSSFSSLSSPCSTSFLMWKGMHLRHCAIGLTVSSTCSFTVMPSILPVVSSNNVWNSLVISAEVFVVKAY